jgi:hypothetical protein
MTDMEHWFCPGCGEIDGPRAGMTCHGPGNTGGCASVGNKVVEISHDAAKRLTGAVDLLHELADAVAENQASPDVRYSHRVREALEAIDAAICLKAIDHLAAGGRGAIGPERRRTGDRMTVIAHEACPRCYRTADDVGSDEDGPGCGDYLNCPGTMTAFVPADQLAGAVSRYSVEEVKLTDSTRLDIIDTEVRSSRHIVGSVHLPRGDSKVIIHRNGLELTDAEEIALGKCAKRLTAQTMSLYQTSEGLRAFVIDYGGAEHPGVPIVPQ